MTIWGCGLKVLRDTAIATIVSYLFQFIFVPDVRISISQSLAFIIGGLWFISGFPIWLLGAKEIKENFEKGQLITSGIFKYIQHPVYFAWGLFYIPSLVFMTRSWIGFVIPVVFYLSFIYRISFEEEYLANKFGEKYINYKNNTGRIFPKLKKRSCYKS